MVNKLKLATFLVLLAAPFVAYGDAVDCSGATHYSSDHRYKKGDRVWYRDMMYNRYSCDKAECYGVNPGKDDTWKFDGHCDKDPS
jgi:hypothetical protein